MNWTIKLIVALWAVALAATDASGRTWHIRQDGFGDYTSVQAGLDHAQYGDTIQIGPGRYETMHVVETLGWTEEVCAEVKVGNITIIGSGVDVTIIGPEAPIRQPAPRPKGIIGIWGVDSCSIENLTVENLFHGIYWGGGVEVRNCVIRENVRGLYGSPTTLITLTDLVFEDNDEHGVAISGHGGSIEVEDCVFSGSETGLLISYGAGSVVERCSFSGHDVALSYQFSAYGSASDCHFSNITTASLVVCYSADVELRNCRLAPCAVPISIYNHARLTGTGNIIPGGTYRTIEVAFADLEMHGSHILNGGSFSVHVEEGAYGPSTIHDLSGNWWGTANEDSIQVWIFDGNDDPANPAFVEYRPYAGQLVGSESLSWGAVKSLYR